MILSTETRNAYSEVYELMKFTDKNDLSKIPIDIFLALKENRNEEYVPKIDFENISQSLSKKAWALYVGLYRNYMIEDKKELEAINRILYKNEIKKSQNTKYNVFSQEKVNKEIVEEKEIEKNKNLVVYKENFLTRIINRIKLLFRSGGNKSGN